MENKIKKSLLFLILILFLQSCTPRVDTEYIPYWEVPTASHLLALSQSKFAQIAWEQQAYVLSSDYKRVQCVATIDVIVLVGSQDRNDEPKIFALEGKTGALLWSFNSTGILVYSKDGLFIGDGTKVYLVDPWTGLVKWQEEIPGIRNITGMMYYDNLLFLNGTGIYRFYVMGNDGQIISKYTQLLDFYSNYKNVPFYPDLPFGYVVSDDVFIQQRGDILYSGYITDRLTNKPLWQVDEDSISNFVILNDYVYWISSDDQIKIAGKRDGNLIETIKIIPNIDIFDPDVAKQHAGYYLCGNSQSNTLYVILGDSRQVFAINFTK